MMTLYVLQAGSYSEETLIGVFSTVRRADNAASRDRKKQNWFKLGDYHVDEVTLNEVIGEDEP